jgi:hypothetical protein
MRILYILSYLFYRTINSEAPIITKLDLLFFVLVLCEDGDFVQLNPEVRLGSQQ